MNKQINGQLVNYNVEIHSLKDGNDWKNYIIAEATDGGELAIMVKELMHFKYMPLGPPNCTHLPASIGGRSTEEIIWFQAMMYNGEENSDQSSQSSP